MRIVMLLCLIAVVTAADWVELHDGRWGRVDQLDDPLRVSLTSRERVTVSRAEVRRVVNDRQVVAELSQVFAALTAGQREQAHALLHGMGEPAAVTLAVIAAQPGQRDRRLLALYCLHSVWAPFLEEQLLPLLAQPDAVVAQATAQVLLERLGEEALLAETAQLVHPVRPEMPQVLAATESVCPDLQRVLAVLRSPTAFRFALPYLARYRSPELHVPARRLLREVDPVVLAVGLHAATCLNNVDGATRRLVREHLSHAAPLVREYAVSYCARHGGDDELQALRGRSDDEHDPFVRAAIQAATQAIERRGGVTLPAQLDGVAAPAKDACRWAWPGSPAYDRARASTGWVYGRIAEPIVRRPLPPVLPHAQSAWFALEQALFQMPTGPLGSECLSEIPAPRARELRPPLRDHKLLAQGFADGSTEATGVVMGAGAVGRVVCAAGDGLVRFAGWTPERGFTVVLEHGDPRDRRFCTVYGHLDQFLHVRPAQLVSAGTQLGSIGLGHSWANGGVPAGLFFGVWASSYQRGFERGKRVELLHQGVRVAGVITRCDGVGASLQTADGAVIELSDQHVWLNEGLGPSARWRDPLRMLERYPKALDPQEPDVAKADAMSSLDVRTMAEELTIQLERHQLPFVLNASVSELREAGGTLADCDGDGAADLIACEMRQGREAISLHGATTSGPWPRRDRLILPAGAHPQAPLAAVAVDGSETVLAILLARDPWLVLVPVNGTGFADDRVVALEPWLPAYDGPLGVEAMPYRLNGVEWDKGTVVVRGLAAVSGSNAAMLWTIKARPSPAGWSMSSEHHETSDPVPALPVPDWSRRFVSGDWDGDGERDILGVNLVGDEADSSEEQRVMATLFYWSGSAPSAPGTPLLRLPLRSSGSLPIVVREVRNGGVCVLLREAQHAWLLSPRSARGARLVDSLADAYLPSAVQRAAEALAAAADGQHRFGPLAPLRWHERFAELMQAIARECELPGEMRELKTATLRGDPNRIRQPARDLTRLEEALSLHFPEPLGRGTNALSTHFICFDRRSDYLRWLPLHYAAMGREGEGAEGDPVKLASKASLIWSESACLIDRSLMSTGSLRRGVCYAYGSMLISQLTEGRIGPALKKGFASWSEAQVLGEPRFVSISYEWREVSQSRLAWDHQARRFLEQNPEFSLRHLLSLQGFDMEGVHQAVCWSLVAYLVQRPERFVAMVEAVRKGASQEEALFDAYGADADTLEALWRAFVADELR